MEKKITIKSSGQRGGITAHTVNISADDGATAERLNELTQVVKSYGPDKHVTDIHTERAEQRLKLIRLRRATNPEWSRNEISALVTRVAEGDLKFADVKIRANIILWAARLHALKEEKLAVVEGYLERLHHDHPDLDASIVEALLLEAKGDVDGALRKLRDIDDADGHATLLTVLARTKGPDSAVAWMDEQSIGMAADFFTETGWTNAAIQLALVGRWEEAAIQLAVVSDRACNWPELAYVEGVINAALLLPLELRKYALAMEIFHPAIRTEEGTQADMRRAQADRCFTLANQLLLEIDESDRAAAAQNWRLWLRLTSPDKQVSAQARLEVQDAMRDGKKAVDFLHFAVTFNIKFDEGPIRRYLTQRSRFGGASGNELAAELMLAKRSMKRRDFSEYLEKEHSRLTGVLPEAHLIGMRIETLIADRQYARAHHLLQTAGQVLSEEDRSRLSAIIEAEQGGDPRSTFEELYKRTGELFDLHNLINHLRNAGDWTALKPLLHELFQRERNADNALSYVDCLHRNAESDPQDILTFLSQASDLVERSLPLASAKAWALFHLGDLENARIETEVLLSRRFDANDVMLDFNITLQSGEWERFPTIVEREWQRREEHTSEALLRLASLAAEVDATVNRALDLAKLAVRKAPQDPHALLGAYTLSVQLGREDDAENNWVARAAELSNEQGPVQTFDMRTIVEEMLPANRKRSNEIEHRLVTGDIPLHGAAMMLGVPLSRILIGLPEQNAAAMDGRQKTIIPIISGAKAPSKIQEGWTVGLDVSSIMLLAYLGILQKATDAFAKVMIAPETMIVLLEERRRVRFHQPSRVQRAEDIRNVIDQGQLKALSVSAEAPSWLRSEVGDELADLLQAADSADGYVIHPYPIHKIGSYMEAEADLKTYQPRILSVRLFCRQLYEAGFFDAGAYETAERYLSVHDRDQLSDRRVNLKNRPIYLDGLAITYLQAAGLLPLLCHSGIELWAHQSLRDDQISLIEANREGEKLVALLNSIRVTLSNAIKSKKVGFLRRDDATSPLDEGTKSLFPTLGQFLNDVAKCDTVCADDRFFNGHSIVTDRHGRSVPITNVISVLQFLLDSGAITEAEGLGCLHKLHCGGFALVPMTAGEIVSRVSAARYTGDNELIEGVELRAIRQLISRVLTLDLIRRPLENPYIESMKFASVAAIRRVWENDEVPVERARVLASWIWNYISLPCVESVRSSETKVSIDSYTDGLSAHFAFLTQAASHTRGERYVAFCAWLEDEILNLGAANQSLLDVIAGNIRAAIDGTIKNTIQ